LKAEMYWTTFVNIFLLKNNFFFPYSQSRLDSFCVQLYFPHTVSWWRISLTGKNLPLRWKICSIPVLCNAKYHKMHGKGNPILFNF
jgi:hypothetical protein